MNTKYSFLLIYLVMILAAGCQSLIEDPKGSLTPGTYFKTQADLDASVSAIYIQFARDGAWGFTNRSTSYFGSDDFTTDPGLNKEDFRLFDRLSGGSGNGSLVAQWQGPWQGIYQAHNVIARRIFSGRWATITW
jgi:starch-binding outer membrane protein, SusD/RagB family